MFITSLAALQIHTTAEKSNPTKHNLKILWRNEALSSPYCCRPLHLQTKKETAEDTTDEFARVEKEIGGIKLTSVSHNGRQVVVHHEFHPTMADGNVIGNVTETAMQNCDVCGLKPKNLDNCNKIKKQPIHKAALKFGFSPLHMLLRFLSLVVALGLHLPFKKWRVSGKAQEKALKEHNREMQRRFKAKMGLLVDVPKSGGVGNTTNGNTARAAFDEIEKLASITGVSQEILDHFSVILKTLRCNFLVDSLAFFIYCEETIE